MPELQNEPMCCGTKMVRIHRNSFQCGDCGKITPLEQLVFEKKKMHSVAVVRNPQGWDRTRR